MPDSIEISVNGEKRTVPRGTTVAELLERLGLAVRHVAVELNYEIIPRPRHGQHQLAPGDSLEVVSLVGGG
jgi:thiamine biosynthesis protein ThiS